MKGEAITYLTDAVLLTAVVPAGRADAILKASPGYRRNRRDCAPCTGNRCA